MDDVEQNGYELIPHYACLPDLAPSDFFLFPNLKKDIRRCHFRSDEEVVTAVEEWFNEKDSDFFSSGLMALEHRWSKCITLEGNYIEKEEVDLALVHYCTNTVICIFSFLCLCEPSYPYKCQYLLTRHHLTQDTWQGQLRLLVTFLVPSSQVYPITLPGPWGTTDDFTTTPFIFSCLHVPKLSWLSPSLSTL